VPKTKQPMPWKVRQTLSANKPPRHPAIVAAPAALREVNGKDVAPRPSHLSRGNLLRLFFEFPTEPGLAPGFTPGNHGIGATLRVPVPVLLGPLK
jgi:hypothetical protein